MWGKLWHLLLRDKAWKLAQWLANIEVLKRPLNMTKCIFCLFSVFLIIFHFDRFTLINSIQEQPHIICQASRLSWLIQSGRGIRRPFTDCCGCVEFRWQGVLAIYSAWISEKGRFIVYIELWRDKSMHDAVLALWQCAMKQLMKSIFPGFVMFCCDLPDPHSSYTSLERFLLGVWYVLLCVCFEAWWDIFARLLP